MWGMARSIARWWVQPMKKSRRRAGDRMGPGDDDGIEGGEGVDAGVRVEKEKRRRTWGNSRQGKAKGG
ncbi:hypothetical protein GW17_00062141 [Ensete ventricosum]|nr:hypothetical protein GW17_00062141 [Ensete ventricosum]